MMNNINSSSHDSLESSIQNLIKNWHRRQQWNKLFFDPNEPNNIASWRKKLANFLESKQVRLVSIFLILLDLILTTLDLSSSLLSCHPNKSENDGLGPTRWYHWVGIAILGTLLAKTAAAAVGLGGAFLRRPGYVVDGVVLAVAMVLELFLERRGGGLVVVVSLWRVVRVVESAFELSDDAIEAQIEGIVSQFEALRGENRRLLEVVDEKDRVIEKLLEDLDRCREALPGSCKSIVGY